MLAPKCLPNAKSNQGIAYDSSGYLLPCCWLVNSLKDQEKEKFGLYAEELKLSNNSSVDNIVYSETWQKFRNMLVNDPESAPVKCHRMCKKC